MTPHLYFYSSFIIIYIFIVYCDRKYNMLRVDSLEKKKPYSFSKVQLAWWTLIIISSLISIMFSTKSIPTFNNSVLILLGITGATRASAKIIDVGDQTNRPDSAGLNIPGENFIVDILSDNKGITTSRFQCVIFNLTFGLWFAMYVLSNIANIPANGIDYIMPDISQNNLILLGISSSTYAAMKSLENKSTMDPKLQANANVIDNKTDKPIINNPNTN